MYLNFFIRKKGIDDQLRVEMSISSPVRQLDKFMKHMLMNLQRI